MDKYLNLIPYFADHAYAFAIGLSVLFWVIFIGRYFASQTERSAWTKFMDIIFMFFYIGLFITYIAVGINIGESILDSAPIGACIGIAAFVLMFEILAYFKKKRMKVEYVRPKRAEPKKPS